MRKLSSLISPLNDVTNNGSALPTGQLEALNIAASPAYRFGGLKVVQNVSTAVLYKYMLLLTNICKRVWCAYIM